MSTKLTHSPATHPTFFYGTAWKEDDTENLTFKALQNGFTAIDTANQRKHYYEEAVGRGIKKYLDLNLATRQNLFIQTKFTFARGQDHRKPYIESDSFTKQVEDSFASSLQHLQTDYIDSYVLHGPQQSEGLTAADLETWAAIETLADSQRVLNLGVSNVSAEQLVALCESVRMKPRFVQNRCYARAGWDKSVREVCKRYGLTYQGFSLLTANTYELSAPEIMSIAKKYNKTIPQIVFRFCKQLGMIVITGTTSPTHMRQDLDIEDFELSTEEVALIENRPYYLA